MNTNRIMKALRALMEAVSDGDGRSAQAQEVVDRAVWDLGVIYDFDFEEGGNVLDLRGRAGSVSVPAKDVQLVEEGKKS